MSQEPAGRGLWTWKHRVAGPTSGAALLWSLCAAVMGGWWLVVFGPLALASAAWVGHWFHVQTLSDQASRIRRVAVDELERRERAVREAQQALEDDVRQDPP